MYHLFPYSDFFLDPEEIEFMQGEPFATWRKEYFQTQIPEKKPHLLIQTNPDHKEKSAVYIPESIVDLHASKKRTREGHLSKNGLMFKVRWLGYSPNEDTWESYQHLKDNIVFHAYCRKHELEYLIPICYYE